MILFSIQHVVSDNFIIHINNSVITLKNSISYLRQLNRKLNWSEHIFQNILKTKQIILQIKRFVRLNWGIDGRILNTLYKSIVEPFLLYGSPIWIGATNKKWCIKKLRSVQRFMAMTTIRAYRTVSTNTALVIARLLPKDLRAQGHAISFFLKNKPIINQKKRANPTILP